MREILFRGKRTDNGEWVCGYYVLRKRPYFKDKGANFEHIICDNLVIDDFNDKQFVDTIPITYSVDPETGFFGESDTSNIYPSDFYMCEIVGNVFDTPEFFEAGVAP